MPNRHYNSRNRKYCECGSPARYRLRVPILRPDLQTIIHAVLYLCEACFALEQELRSLDGRKPPRVRRIV